MKGNTLNKNAFRHSVFGLGIITAAAFWSGTATAQFVNNPVFMKPPERGPGSDAPPSADPRNLEGIWLGQAGDAPPPWLADTANLTEKAKEAEAYSRAMSAKGTPLVTLSARCRPMQAQLIGRDLFPASVTQTDKLIVILNEEGRGRWVIQMDSKHPEDLKPSYWGDSIGHWEGDSLVVETVGFNGQEPLLSTQARVVTRIRKIDGGRKLEIKQTTIDPVNYISPIERINYSLWRPDLQVLEFQCEENMEGALEGMVSH